MNVHVTLSLVMDAILWNTNDENWPLSFCYHFIVYWSHAPLIHDYDFFVATLALGSRPRQGLAKVRAKKEARESHFMLPGVQRVWWKELSHSQVNSHVGSWSFGGLSNVQRAIEGVKIHWIKVFLISLESSWNVDVEWACMIHLNIRNTSYGQKKGRESIWQFDS